MNLIRDIFDQLYSDKVEITPAKDAPPKHRYFVISGKDGPRWIIPCNPALGWPALRFWTPFNFTSRLLWQGLIEAYRLRGLGLVPGVDTIGVAGTGGSVGCGVVPSSGVLSRAELGLPGNTRTLGCKNGIC